MQSQPRPTPKRILGIDYGLTRIGLALSDETKMIAMPLQILLASKKSEQTVQSLLNTIEEISKKYQCIIDEIVIGLPLMMSGKTGIQADEVKHFVELFAKSCPIPVKTWDERLSTVQADRALRESNYNRKKRTKFVDTVSACIILQSYLDSLSFILP